MDFIRRKVKSEKPGSELGAFLITKPMLAVAVEDLNQVRFPVIASPKLDGIRCVKVGGKALSRKFKPIPNHFVRNWIEQNCPDGFDGEIMCSGLTFNQIQSEIMSEDGEPSFQYVVFDYVKDDLKKPYEDRLKDLVQAMTLKDSGRLQMNDSVIVDNLDTLKNYEEQCVNDGFEGVMIRSLSSPYKLGRSTLKEQYLLKIKRFEDAEAVVVGFEEKMKNNNKLEKNELGYAKRSSSMSGLEAAGVLGALLVKDPKTGEEFSIGSGFGDIMRKEIWNNKDKYLNKLVTYKFQPSGGKDLPRFPVFKGFRSD